MLNANEIFTRMYTNDAFSKWLGITLHKIEPGFCSLTLTVRPDMLNGFGIAHGGISYALADSALAFAANSKGQHAVSIETSISHLEKIKSGTTLIAEAHELNRNEKLAHYSVRLSNEDSKNTVALFKGIVYLSSKNWE